MTQTPERAAPRQDTTLAWQEALRTRTTVTSGSPAVAIASRRGSGVSRRRFLAASFWSGLGVSLLAAMGGALDFIFPRGVIGFGGPVPAGNIADYPRGGRPVHNFNGQFWLVNLDPTDTAANGSGGGEGLLALWRKCPHLGCSVPWNSVFVLPNSDGSQGWFRCPCHASTYNKAGVRVHGPAPRSMDTMRIEVDEIGAITVHTGDVLPGGVDNPGRATPV